MAQFNCFYAALRRYCRGAFLMSIFGAYTPAIHVLIERLGIYEY